MATFSVIPEKDAPVPTSHYKSRLAERMRDYNTYVTNVGAGKVGKLVATSDETTRGLALRVARAAKRAGLVSRTWAVGDTLYFSIGVSQSP